MTWEWSHAPEAYADLYENIHEQPREWLLVVYAEWKASSGGYFHPRQNARTDFDERRYLRALVGAECLCNETLADKIYELAERLRLCTNGGWEAWCCPHGCGCHQLPFSRPDADA